MLCPVVLAVASRLGTLKNGRWGSDRDRGGNNTTHSKWMSQQVRNEKEMSTIQDLIEVQGQKTRPDKPPMT